MLATRTATVQSDLSIRESSAPGMLTINGTRYIFRTLPASAAAGCRHVVRLVKSGEPFDAECYDVACMTDGTVSCTCPDAVYRKEPKQLYCKHAVAVVAHRLDVPRHPGPSVIRHVPNCPGLRIVELPEFVNRVEQFSGRVGWVECELSELTGEELDAIDHMMR